MFLYLLRHAEAAPYQADDFARRLTEKGIAQAGRVGELLLRNQMIPDLILSSPVLRAKETAEIVTRKLTSSESSSTLAIAPWLACGMKPDTAISELSAYSRLDSVMIVGHEPDFSTLCASLLAMESGENMSLSKASLTGIELARFAPRCGVLRFFLPVRII